MKRITIIAAVAFFPLQVLFGQCFPDRHNTNWFDGWISCEAFPNPNANNGTSHWIMYDLGEEHHFFGLKIWNTNDPSSLEWGIKDALIEVSNNGVDWQTAGTFEINQAIGQNTYEGEDVIELDGIQGRYLLITALSNWGGSCFGLSEIEMEVESAQMTTSTEDEVLTSRCFSSVVYPNPFQIETRLMLRSECNAPIRYEVVDILGRTHLSGMTPAVSGMYQIDVDQEDMPSGTYLVQLTQGDRSEQHTLIKTE